MRALVPSRKRSPEEERGRKPPRGKEKEREREGKRNGTSLVLNDGNSPRSEHLETMRVRCLQRCPLPSSFSFFRRTRLTGVFCVRTNLRSRDASRASYERVCLQGPYSGRVANTKYALLIPTSILLARAPRATLRFRVRKTRLLYDTRSEDTGSRLRRATRR